MIKANPGRNSAAHSTLRDRPGQRRHAERPFSHRPLTIYNRGLYNFARNALAPNKFRAICPIFDTVIGHVLHSRYTMNELRYHAGKLTDAFSPSKITQEPDFLWNSQNPNYFRELLGVLTEEELIRFRHRLKKAGNLRIAEVLTDEIQKQSAIPAAVRFAIRCA